MLNFMKMFFIGMIGFFIGMIGFVLFGCDQNIPTEVYTISLYNNEKIQWTKAKLIFEVPTKQEFVKTHKVPCIGIKRPGVNSRFFPVEILLSNKMVSALKESRIQIHMIIPLWHSVHKYAESWWLRR